MGISVVTGANRGIGLELCRELKARGKQVVGVCRKPSGELEALGVRIEANVDVTNFARVAALGEKLAKDELDLLVNNAGILRADSLDSVDPETVREELAINAIAPLFVTRALVGRMHPGSKVALVTSRMGSIGDNTSGGYYGYRMSKAALNAAGVSLAIDLREREISVVILHPGFVRTEMTGRQGMIEPAESARGLLDRIEELSLATSGRFLHMNGEALPW